MPQLSWDLHVHPAPSSVPRWGTGAEVRAAAARAGVRGFVWKSHEEHTAARARALPPGEPVVVGSASLNDWASVTDVAAAVADGARWIWGPSRAPGLRLGWDLPLPTWWPALLEALDADRPRLVFATGHTDAAGRRAMAEAARTNGDLCSVTHALRIPPGEAEELARLGCLLEVDLYTTAHPVPGLKSLDLVAGLARLAQAGLPVYITTDAGQAEVGDPYRFSSVMLAALAERIGEDAVVAAAGTGPTGVATALGLA